MLNKGIHLDDEKIIHRWGDNDGIGHSIGLRGNVTSIFGVQFNKAQIVESKISLVLEYGGKVRVNNYLDAKYKYVISHKRFDLGEKKCFFLVF